jgi:hypothetical protein
MGWLLLWATRHNSNKHKSWQTRTCKDVFHNVSSVCKICGEFVWVDFKSYWQG